MNETEILSKVAVNIVTELFKKSLVGINSLGKWIITKNKQNDIIGNAAKKYVNKLGQRYSFVRVIGMQKPLQIRQIYVKVRILNAVSSLQVLSIKELEELFYKDDKKYDDERLRQLSERQKTEGDDEVALVDKTRKKIPGIDLVDNERRIYLLGRPGAGKTTFLKSLIISSLDGKLKEKQIPVYINLKDWSDSGMDIFSFVNLQFDICNLPESELFVEQLLNRGKCLVLFDGLDEALNNDDNIINQLESFIDKYLDNRYIITCRIAASNYVFEKFIEVEMADFDLEQIHQFILNWFTEESDKAMLCWNKLNEEQNRRILDLATTPLLLTLICINFENSLNIPNNKAELYKEALDILLKKWDSSRNIQREVVYQELSLRKKETLLSQIAFNTFTLQQLFFNRRQAEKYIQDFILNLNNIDVRTIEPDSKTILESIEAQHGLLIERAKNIYSFSHLTLQEYFTARYLSDNFHKKELREKLNSNILNSRWKEVFIITSGILPEADDFLLKMQNAILEKYNDFDLQKLLTIIYSSIRDNDYFPIEIRRCLAIYFALDLNEPREIAQKENIKLTKVRWNALSLINSLATSYSLKERFSPVINLSKNIRYDNTRNFVDDLNRAINYNSEINKNEGENIRVNENNISVLNEYILATKTLLDCLNADCYLTNENRKIIHERILVN